VIRSIVDPPAFIMSASFLFNRISFRIVEPGTEIVLVNDVPGTKTIFRLDGSGEPPVVGTYSSVLVTTPEGNVLSFTFSENTSFSNGDPLVVSGPWYSPFVGNDILHVTFFSSDGTVMAHAF